MQIEQPKPDNATGTINTVGLEQMSASERISTTELRARSHDLELLISLASVFSLIAAPEQMLQWFVANLAGMSESLVRVSMSLIMLLGSSFYALAIVFGLHLILRATWVAVIGLETHFVAPKNWKEGYMVGPIGFEEQRRLGIDQPSNLLHHLDRTATTMFVLGVSLIAIAFIGIAAIFIAMAFSVIAAWLKLPDWVAWILIGPYLLLMLLWSLPAMLDRYFGGKGKTLPNWLQRLIRYAARSANSGMLLSFNRTLAPLMTDKAGRLGYFVVIGLFAFFTNSFGQHVRTTVLGKQFSATVETQLDTGRVTRSYREEMDADTSMFPNIQSVITHDPLIRLSLPIHWYRDREAMTQLCGASFEQALMGCAQKYWAVKVNGKALAGADWLLYANREKNQIGVDVFFSLDKVGPHVIQVQRWLKPGDKAQTALNIPVYLTAASQ
jgi:hypothetical protein